MHGMRTLSLVFGGVGLCLALLTLGCDKSQNAGGTTAATVGSEESAPRSSRPTRGEVACRLHSCAPPYFCNEDKGVCEMLPCIESRDCPYDYKCDLSQNVCR